MPRALSRENIRVAIGLVQLNARVPATHGEEALWIGDFDDVAERAAFIPGVLVVRFANAAWSQLRAGARVYVRFAESRPRLFDLMFGPLRGGAKRAGTRDSEPSGRKAYQQLSEALDDLVSSGRLTPQRRVGAENTLWPLIHGLAVLRRVGALREPFEVSWQRMLKFTADGLGIDLRKR
jgi:hypothetical protein